MLLLQLLCATREFLQRDDIFTTTSSLIAPMLPRDRKIARAFGVAFRCLCGNCEEGTWLHCGDVTCMGKRHYFEFNRALFARLDA
jgi:hypothetical protein